MNKKVIGLKGLDADENMQKLKTQLAWLANQSEGKIPTDAKAIIIFGSPEHKIVGNFVANIISENNLSVPVYISGDGTKGDSAKITEAANISNEIKKNLGSETEIEFILDPKAQNTEENAINIRILLEENGLSTIDSFVYINFPVLSRQGQMALEEQNINNIFTITPTITDEKIKDVEGWIKFKVDTIGDVAEKPE